MELRFEPVIWLGATLLRNLPAEAEDARRWILGVEFVDERAAMVENGALVERAFVGDFAVVEGGRLVEQDGALDAIRGAG